MAKKIPLHSLSAPPQTKSLANTNRAVAKIWSKFTAITLELCTLAKNPKPRYTPFEQSEEDEGLLVKEASEVIDNDWEKIGERELTQTEQLQN